MNCIEAQIRLGKMVRELRETKGWTQQKLADRVGLHRTYIGSVERGERNITLDSILNIAKTLHVKPSQLLKDATL